jgi:ribonuclease Z
MATSPAGCFIAHCWSTAGFSTIIHVKALNSKLSVLFDCGSLIASTVSARHVFITHGHCDHIGSTIQHARAGALNRSGSAYFVPESCVDALLSAKRGFDDLDGHQIDMNLSPMRPGESVPLGQDFRVFAFPTVHRVPSQGYCIVKRNRLLLEELRGSDHVEIRRLRNAGVKTHEDSDSYELAYTGDTTIATFLNPDLSFLLRVPVLIVEMTYLDGDREKASTFGHMHLDEFLENERLFQNEYIIFVHISEKYRPHTRALRLLREKVPAYLHSRIGVALRGLGAHEDVTELLDRRSFSRRRGEEEDAGVVCAPCRTSKDA